MALQLGALRDALIDAGVSADKAGEAAAEVAEYANRFASKGSRITALTWIVGATFGVSLLIISSLFGIWLRLGELCEHLAQTVLAAPR